LDKQLQTSFSCGRVENAINFGGFKSTWGVCWGGEMQGKWEKAAAGLAKQCDIAYTPWEHLQMEKRI